MIRLAHPHISDSVHGKLREIVESGMMTSGRRVNQLERSLSQRLSGRHVVLVSSGTTAALLAFHILRQRGVSRAILPDFLYPSMASSALRCGLAVEVVDIEPTTLSIDIDAVASANPGPETVVVSVDQFGIPGPNTAVRELCLARGAVWFEDAACGLGAAVGDAPCGTSCDLAILSFHPRKVLTTGEGGALVTPDDEIAAKARLLRDHGVAVRDGKRVFLEPGYNARLSELHAAVGLSHLELFDQQLEQRRKLGQSYLQQLSGSSVEVPAGYQDPGCNFQTLAVWLPPDVDRSCVVSRMRELSVETTMAGFAIHRQIAFAAVKTAATLTESLKLHERGLALPLHERMSVPDVRLVVQALGRALEEQA